MIKINKKIPNQPRVTRTIKKVVNLVKNANINSLPVNPLKLYKNNMKNCYLWTKTESKKKYGNSPYKIIDAISFGRWSQNKNTGEIYNKEFITVYNDKKYTYNNVNCKERISWTLAHEVGHICLGHLTDFEDVMVDHYLNKTNYEVLEKEANRFAAELLSPTIVLQKLKVTNRRDIRLICNLSKKASYNRERNIEWYANNSIYNKFRKFYKKQFNSILKPVSLCVDPDLISKLNIKTLKRKKEVNILSTTYNYVETNENGKFINCPQCGNENFSEEANFCKLCGLYLYNNCSNSLDTVTAEYQQDFCGKENPGDARYCEYCGAPTLLFRKGILKSWKEIIESHNSITIGLEENQNKDFDKEEVEIPF